MHRGTIRRLTLGAALATLTIGGGACGDDEGGITLQPAVETMRITVGPNQYNAIAPTGFSTEIGVADVEPLTVAAAFLADGGLPDPAVDDDDFQLIVLGATEDGPCTADLQGFTFNRTSPFGGTIGGFSTGTTGYFCFGLRRNGATEYEFGPYKLGLRRSPSTNPGGPGGA